MKLSFTANSMYQECSQKYKYRYIDKIKETTKSSALHFGACLDSALNRVLLVKKKTLTEEEQALLSKTAIEIFKDQFSVEEIPIEYSYSDVDPVMFGEDEKFIDKLLNHWKEFKVKDDEFVTYAKRSLVKKAELLLTEYENVVLPQIEEVYKIQHKIELLNEADDSLIGVIDLVAKFSDGIIYTVDHKTTSTTYSDDSASTSDQLATYAEAEQNPHVMFITIDKKIRKKVPKVRIKLIKGKIDEKKFEEVFDNLGNTLYNIKHNMFSKKENRNECFSYGKRCPYYDLCWKN